MVLQSRRERRGFQHHHRRQRLDRHPSAVDRRRRRQRRLQRRRQHRQRDERVGGARRFGRRRRNVQQRHGHQRYGDHDRRRRFDRHSSAVDRRRRRQRRLQRRGKYFGQRPHDRREPRRQRRGAAWHGAGSVTVSNGSTTSSVGIETGGDNAAGIQAQSIGGGGGDGGFSVAGGISAGNSINLSVVRAAADPARATAAAAQSPASLTTGNIQYRRRAITRRAFNAQSIARRRQQRRFQRHRRSVGRQHAVGIGVTIGGGAKRQRRRQYGGQTGVVNAVTLSGVGNIRYAPRSIQSDGIQAQSDGGGGGDGGFQYSPPAANGLQRPPVRSRSTTGGNGERGRCGAATSPVTSTGNISKRPVANSDGIQAQSIGGGGGDGGFSVAGSLTNDGSGAAISIRRQSRSTGGTAARRPSRFDGRDDRQTGGANSRRYFSAIAGRRRQQRRLPALPAISAMVPARASRSASGSSFGERRIGGHRHGRCNDHHRRRKLERY